jgi:pimeloyl-ACP methyl ester carboxylesterase
LQVLEDNEVLTKYKEVYFIGHSMGGLVIKRMLGDLNRPGQVEKLRKVTAVLYVSTPAQGADLADYGSWLSLNPQLRDMRPADLNSFLQTVENQWQNLMRERGKEVFPRVFCAYETKPTYGKLVVSRVYAATICDQNPFPINEDHAAIVKPFSMDADIYKWSRKRIRETSVLAQGAAGLAAGPQPIAKTFAPETSSPCASEGSAIAVRAYALARTDDKAFAAYVRENASLFAEDGVVIKCLQVLTFALTKLAVEKEPLPRNPPEIMFLRLLGGTGETGVLADQLSQLAATLPALAKGDKSQYEQTDIYSYGERFQPMDPKLAARLAFIKEQELRAVIESLPLK